MPKRNLHRGDSGETRLLSGHRVRKDDPRIECVGSIDELSSFLGLARAGLEERVATAGVPEMVARFCSVEMFCAYCVTALLSACKFNASAIPAGSSDGAEMVWPVETWF